MNQPSCGGIQSPVAGDHLRNPGAGIHSGRSLRVLIWGMGGQQDHFHRILAANIQRWGYEARILTASIVPEKGRQDEIQGDVLLYDLDDPSQLCGLIADNTALPFAVTGSEGWQPRVRLMIALSSQSISRSTLEQIGAVALIHKPFEMGRLQRYLRVFDKVLLDESSLESERGFVEQAFSLPVPLAATSLLRGDAMPAGTRKKVRILVVDDHVEIADTIRQCLECESAYQVKIANDGLEALEQYISWRPDCIVTDLLMPWMNGFQVMRSLSVAISRHMPVFVVMSALTQYELPVNRAYLQGKVVVFVNKPFHIDHLLDAVKQALTQ